MPEIKPITSATIGEWLQKGEYMDLYEEIWEQGNRYFSRQGGNGDVDLVIVFQDIEDFSESTTSQTTIDFQRHKDRLFLVVWTLNDLSNPLGFPIPFSISEPDELHKLEKIKEQSKVWIHYLALEDEQLIHIYSESTPLPEIELNKELKLQEAPSVSQGENEEEQIYEKEADKLSDEQLLQTGFGYAIDFSSMINKLGEEASEEKLMTAVHEAVLRMRTHPFPKIRDSNFLIWVAEKRNRIKPDMDSRLLTIFISSDQEEIIDFDGATEEENPFTTILLTLPEFLATLQASPIEHGGYPIMEYDAGKLMHIQLDKEFRQRLSKFWSGEGVNPYLQEE